MVPRSSTIPVNTPTPSPVRPVADRGTTATRVLAYRFHPDYDRRLRNHTGSVPARTQALAEGSASNHRRRIHRRWEFHPAPENYVFDASTISHTGIYIYRPAERTRAPRRTCAVAAATRLRARAERIPFRLRAVGNRGDQRRQPGVAVGDEHARVRRRTKHPDVGEQVAYATTAC